MSDLDQATKPAEVTRPRLPDYLRELWQEADANYRAAQKRCDEIMSPAVGMMGAVEATLAEFMGTSVEHLGRCPTCEEHIFDCDEGHKVVDFVDEQEVYCAEHAPSDEELRAEAERQEREPLKPNGNGGVVNAEIWPRSR